jgi:hypothetical protein
MMCLYDSVAVVLKVEKQAQDRFVRLCHAGYVTVSTLEYARGNYLCPGLWCSLANCYTFISLTV